MGFDVEKVDLEKWPRFLSGKKDREAAVLVPLVKKDGIWNVLFEVRNKTIKFQPGDICFPGGGIEEGEEPVDAAVRETAEELLIDESKIKILGRVDGTIGPVGSPIWAYLAIVECDLSTFDKEEVDHLFLVPVDELLAMEPVIGHATTETILDEDFPGDLIPGFEHYHWRGLEREYFFYPWKDYMIWGATARMLHSFLERIKA